MPSTVFLIIFGIISAVCAYAAANLARKQGRSVPFWAALTFVLPAVLLFLMKAQVEQDQKSSRQI